VTDKVFLTQCILS